MQLDTNTQVVLIVFGVLIAITTAIFIIVVCCLYRRNWRCRREHGESGEHNQDVPMSDIAPGNENLPPSHITMPENYDQLVLDHVFRMHQELPPLEPSAPPLPPP